MSLQESPRPRRWLKSLIKLACVVTVSFIVTWATAWARILSLSWPYADDTQLTTLIDGEWAAPVPSNWPPQPDCHLVTPRTGFVMNAWGINRDRPSFVGISGRDTYSLAIFDVGWPRPCLRWVAWREDHYDYSANPSTFTSKGTPPPGISRWVAGLDFPAALARYDPDTWKRLPVKPLPGPMFESIAFFSAVLVTPFFLYLVTRYTVRLIQHRCTCCGYSREGLPEGAPCPECGR